MDFTLINAENQYARNMGNQRHLPSGITERGLGQPVTSFPQQQFPARFATALDQPIAALGDPHREFNPQPSTRAAYSDNHMVHNTGPNKGLYSTMSTIHRPHRNSNPRLANSGANQDRFRREMHRQSTDPNADLRPEQLLLGDNLAHFKREIEPFFYRHQVQVPPNSTFLQQPLAAARRLVPVRPPVLVPHPRRPISHMPEHRPSARDSGLQPAHQQRQERPISKTPEAAQSEETGPNNGERAQANQRPPKGFGKRGLRSQRLHAEGKCIYCKRPNLDLSKMGCPECLPIRAALTNKYRRRKVARDKAEAARKAAAEEEHGEGVGEQGGDEDGGEEDTGEEDLVDEDTADEDTAEEDSVDEED